MTDTTKQLLMMIGAIFIVALIIGLIIKIDTPPAYVLGLTLGCLTSCLKVLMLASTINKSLDLPVDQSQTFARAHFLVRYFLSAAVLIASALVPWISLVGAIIGILSLQPAAYLVKFIFKPR